MKKLILCLIGLTLISCASMTRTVKGFAFKDMDDKYNGKTPAELRDMLGEPLFAGWVTRGPQDSHYLMVYPSDTTQKFNFSMAKYKNCTYVKFLAKHKFRTHLEDGRGGEGLAYEAGREKVCSYASEHMQRIKDLSVDDFNKRMEKLNLL